ncbi:NADH-quinone oxidoreductase subunit E [Motilibacter peucedani]|uniref:NADH-quinone oxidoreductase subunit E n=1 Tax=Motilibacter peucedani TaxID=598650 RepID=A0A420XKT1_9ACTN|nr:NADH-quinone oxidoreductase subunit NuoE [Motilibacter peucedani]RKS69209.1 NADH-quinone oxidoreductase subunit E [Motilibacter peucedani]
MAISEQALVRLEADAAEVIARYPRPRSALLPLLHLVQSEEGWVSPEGVELCARWVGLTTAEVTAVSTFYSMYRREPGGDYNVGVCTNTLCGVLGGDAILERLESHLGVHHGETAGNVTLEHLECNAACDYAPVVMVNWEFYDNQTPSSAVELVDALQAGTPPAPSRGVGRLCTFRETERVLAGFEDGLADTGTGSGPATLAGLRLARERGWSAPRPGTTSTSADGAGAPATGYGRSGGPSGDDAPLRTAASDPANTTPAAASGSGSGKPEERP